MKKRAIKITAVLLALLCYGIYWAFFDLQRLRGQEFLVESASPGGSYVVTAYRNNGGAGTSFAVLCTMENKKIGEKRNIYWQAHRAEADIQWIDDDTVVINGRTLDLPGDTYDYRND